MKRYTKHGDIELSFDYFWPCWGLGVYFQLGTTRPGKFKMPYVLGANIGPYNAGIWWWPKGDD